MLKKNKFKNAWINILNMYMNVHLIYRIWLKVYKSLTRGKVLNYTRLEQRDTVPPPSPSCTVPPPSSSCTSSYSTRGSILSNSAPALRRLLQGWGRPLTQVCLKSSIGEPRILRTTPLDYRYVIVALIQY